MASRFSPRIVYWAFALFLVAVAGLTGLWFVGANLVREHIAATGRALAGEGGTFRVDTLNITGFPFRFDAALGGITVAGRDSHGAWEWRADRAVVHLAPWLSRDASFDLAGTHKLRFHVGRIPLDLEVKAASAPGEIRMGENGKPHLLRITPAGLTAREVTTGSRIAADSANLQLFLYPERKAANTEPSAGMLLELSGVALPEKLAGFLGPKLDKLSAEVQVLSDLPVPVNRQNLARWREGGGSVEVRNLALQWGPLHVDGSGTITLDPGLQPEASFAARMSGFEEATNALVTAGLIREQDAETVKLLLSLMARRNAPGEAAQIRVPISIQEHTIFVGPARLARMPTIRW